MESSEIERVSVKDFRKKGYLQELNRTFLHPLGMALEIIIDSETGEEKIGGILDYRNDDEGVIFDLKNSNQDRIDRFVKNRDFILKEFHKRAEKRMESLGFSVEPLPGEEAI